MTEFLVRTFVKNFEDTEDHAVRTSYGILSSCVGIVCNILLFFVKLVIGFLMHSLAITADALNNLSDAASSIISFIGVRMASKPADQEHPFGHGRIEYIAALIVSFLVIEVGLSSLKNSFDKLLHPEPVNLEWIPFGILLLSVGVKLWMAAFNRKLGKRIDSKVMLATAADSSGDVIVTSATLVSILIGHFASVNIDAAAGILVSLLVMWAGVTIAKDTIEPLIGEKPDPELCRRLKEMVEAYDGIVGTHDMIIHNYGPNRSMASIHAEVPCDVNIEDSHEVIDRVEREVGKKLGIFLVIHMDPVEIHDEEVLEAKEKLDKVVKTLDEGMSFHDFRLVKGHEQMQLIFDLVVPFAYSREQAEQTVQQICTLMETINSQYRCRITVDRDFLG